MSFKKPWRVAGLLAIGVLVGSVIGPPIVQAATSLVTIQGAGSTHKAKVSSTGRLYVDSEAAVNKAGQLLTGQGAPSTYKAIFIGATPDCTTPGFTVPAGKAFIVTDVTYFITSSSPPSEGDLLLVIGTGGTCASFVSAAITLGGETVTEPYPTGIPLSTGTQLSIVPLGVGAGSAVIYGYLVPAGAISVHETKELQRFPKGGLLGRSSG